MSVAKKDFFLLIDFEVVKEKVSLELMCRSLKPFKKLGFRVLLKEIPKAENAIFRRRKQILILVRNELDQLKE